MPFLVGPSPIRRTLNYLRRGKLYFKDYVKVMTIHYNIAGHHHQGIRDFVLWYMPQIQYKNPDVQIVALRNMTPTPLIRCWLESGEDVLFDVFDKTDKEIMDHLIKILGKSKEKLEKERLEDKISSAKFGSGCSRHCICEIPGQVPCPGVVKLPNYMRVKKFKEEMG